MKATINKSKLLRWLIVFLIALIFLGGTAYLGRGVVRSDILPAYASHLHKNQLATVLNAQQTTVNAALEPLGLKFDHDSDNQCSLDIAIGWSTAIYCGAEVDSSAFVATGLNGKSPQVQRVNRTMHQLGWNGGTDRSGFTLLGYDKVAQGFDCVIQIFNDSTQSRLFCSQEFNYFGNPYKHL